MKVLFLSLMFLACATGDGVYICTGDNPSATTNPHHAKACAIAAER